MSQADAFDTAGAYHFTLPALAEVFDVTEVQIRNYVKQGMPQAARGRYDIRECVQWVIDYKLGRSKSTTESSSAAELNVARRRKLELELAQQAGRLVPIDHCAQAFVAIATAVAGALDALSPRAAPKVATETSIAAIELLLADETRTARQVVAEAIDRFADELGNEGRQVVRDETAPKPAAKRATKKKAARKKRTARKASDADA